MKREEILTALEKISDKHIEEVEPLRTLNFRGREVQHCRKRFFFWEVHFLLFCGSMSLVVFCRNFKD